MITSKRISLLGMSLVGSLLTAATMVNCGSDEATPAEAVGGAAGQAAGGSGGAAGTSPTSGNAGSKANSAGSAGAPATTTSFALVPCPEFPESKDPKCSREKGSVGSGPTFPDSATDGVGAEIQGGFVDAANKRLVTVSGGILTGGVKYAAVMAVDLATGNRTLVSGTILDPATGPQKKGTGPELLGQTVVIAEGKDGWYFLSDLNTAAGQTAGIIKIDPATGNRTTAASFAGFTGVCASLNGNLAAAPNGMLYVPFINIDLGKGIAEIVPGAAPTCKAIVNATDPAVGSGAEPAFPWRVGYAKDKVWVLDSQKVAVYSIDPATGASVVVSDKAGSVGKGDKCFGRNEFAVSDSIIWTMSHDESTGCTGEPSVVSIDPTNGQRATGSNIGDGPGAAASLTAAFPVPNEKNIVLLAAGNKVVVYDMSKNLTNNFSF